VKTAKDWLIVALLWVLCVLVWLLWLLARLVQGSVRTAQAMELPGRK
jgi:flagellar biogenesis protein FliO